MKKSFYIALLLCLPFARLFAQTAPALVADLETGSTSSFPYSLITCNGSLYFFASVATSTNVYQFTSTPSTVFLGVPTPSPLGTVNNKVYFQGDYLRSYTGSGSTTIVDPIIQISLNSDPPVASAGNLYFVGDTVAIHSSSYTITGICYVDPANAAHFACDISTLSVGSSSVNSIGQLNILGGKLYFHAQTGVSDDLGVYDPSTTTTSVIPYFSLGSIGDGDIQNMITASNSKLYFSAATSAEGLELYTYSGTGTPTKITSLNGTLDGVQIAMHSNIAEMGGYIYFGGCDGVHGYELMRLKMSDNSVTLVKDINPSAASSDINNLFVFAGKLYFNANDGTHGPELWVTDGTTTTMVADTYSGATGSNPMGFAIYNNKLYFSADDGISGAELYSFGGTFLSVASVNMVNEVNVYPNPTSDLFDIKIDLKKAADLTVKITDVLGKTIYTTPAQACKEGVSDIKLSLQQYPAGVYYYSVSSGNGATVVSGSISRK